MRWPSQQPLHGRFASRYTGCTGNSLHDREGKNSIEPHGILFAGGYESSRFRRYIELSVFDPKQYGPPRFAVNVDFGVVRDACQAVFIRNVQSTNIEFTIRQSFACEIAFDGGNFFAGEYQAAQLG